MNVLGISLGHDGNLALVRDGEVMAMIESERYFRQKRYKLHAEDLAPGKKVSGFQYVDIEDLKQTLEMAGAQWGKCFDGLAVQNQGREVEYQNILQILDQLGFSFGERHQVNHHLSHAALAFYTAPFSDAIVLSFDGEGNDGHTLIFKAHPKGIEYVENNPIRFGRGYNNAGFIASLSPDVAGSTAGKLMGLSAYGRCREGWMAYAREYVRSYVKFSGTKLEGIASHGKGHQINSTEFNKIRELWKFLNHRDGRFPTWLERLSWNFKAPDPKDWYLKLSGSQDPVAQDLSNTVQIAWSREVLEILAKYRGQSENICVVGGCALNGTTNFNLQQAGYFKRHHFVPNPTDCGLSAGAALWIYHRATEKPFEGYGRYFSPYLGLEPFDLDQLPKYRQERPHRVVDEAQLPAIVAKLIHENYVVGVIRGRYEVGPRALGNRSILANPLHPEMRQILNDKVKHREWYRPFAPVALADEAKKFFDHTEDIPYMSVICHVRPEYRDKLPSITHVDGTARLQTVREDQNPFLVRTIREFEKRTGFPILLNTSFNPGGEPIVNFCHVGLAMLDKTKMDFVLIENTLFYRPEYQDRITEMLKI